MKYKVGNKIVVRADFKKGMDVPCFVVSEMEAFAGKELNIVGVHMNHYACAENFWSWSDEMIDHEATEALQRKELTEDEPKPKYKVGQTVVIRNDLKWGEGYGGMIMCNAMMQFVGKTVQIKWGDGTSYAIVGYEHPFFTDEMIDHEATAKLPTCSCEKKDVDLVNYPPHYTFSSIEAIEVIDAFFKNNYYLGQVFKYISRAGHKGNEMQDLEKAQWFLNRYIEEKEGK